MRARVAVVVVSCRSDDCHNSLIFVPAESASVGDARKEVGRQTDKPSALVYDPDAQACHFFWTTIVVACRVSQRIAMLNTRVTHASTEAPNVQLSEGSHLRDDGPAQLRGWHRGTQAMEHLDQTLTHTGLEFSAVPRDLDFAVCVPGVA